jgi:hypothetical protein
VLLLESAVPVTAAVVLLAAVPSVAVAVAIIAGWSLCIAAAAAAGLLLWRSNVSSAVCVAHGQQCTLDRLSHTVGHNTTLREIQYMLSAG